jgi:hypothetical protein
MNVEEISHLLHLVHLIKISFILLFVVLIVLFILLYSIYLLSGTKFFQDILFLLVVVCHAIVDPLINGPFVPFYIEKGAPDRCVLMYNSDATKKMSTFQ